MFALSHDRRGDGVSGVLAAVDPHPAVDGERVVKPRLIGDRVSCIRLWERCIVHTRYSSPGNWIDRQEVPFARLTVAAGSECTRSTEEQGHDLLLRFLGNSDVTPWSELCD